MYAGAGQHGADGYLSVGNIQVKLVAARVLQVSMTILLCADVALPRQLAEHPGQFLMALPLNTRTARGNFGLGKSTLGACALALLDGPLLGLVLLLLLLFRFRKTLPRWNRGRIPGNMSDESLVLRGGNHRLMQLLRQLGVGEFGESAREFRLVRQSLYAGPAAEPPQRFIHAQPTDQAACGRKIQNGFRQEGSGQSSPILGRAAGGGPPRA